MNNRHFTLHETVLIRQSVSVAMAVCNGELFIRDQIESILVQLNSCDELVISYDTSVDKTWEIVSEYEQKDERVTVLVNGYHEKGLVSNFENALRHCKNEIIFYSDQDDIWEQGKIDKVCNKFRDKHVSVVIHDAKLVDAELNILSDSTFKLRHGNTSLIRNLVRLSYIGCCMAFRREMLSVILPIPNIPRAHDWWTGSICSCYGKMAMIEDALILHRMHDNNATSRKRPPIKHQIKVRIALIINLIRRRLSQRSYK